MTPVAVRRLAAVDVPAYRAIRLERLVDSPGAFGESPEREEARPLAEFADALERDLVLGAFADDQMLSAIVGLSPRPLVKLAHKATVFGMYVRPQFRGRGIGRALVAALLDVVPPGIEELMLTVVSTNLPALHLYRSNGFVEYGYEARALRVDDRYHDEILMCRRM